MAPIGTHHARTELRSTRSSMGCRGGRVFPAQAPRCMQEGGKNALGGLIPFFLDQVKRLKGQNPVRLNLRIHPRNSLPWRRGHRALSVPSLGGLPGPPPYPFFAESGADDRPDADPDGPVGNELCLRKGSPSPQTSRALRTSSPARMRLNRRKPRRVHRNPGGRVESSIHDR